MRAVITIIGKDQRGIVHRMSGILLENGINLEDISQTLMDEFFTMVALVDLKDMTISFEELVKAYDELAEEMGLKIRVQHEDLFNYMHQV